MAQPNQTYTLEEAAGRLGITVADMKKRLQTDPDFKKLSQIRDGATVRFKAAAIDELARQLGQASDDGLPLAADDAEPPSSDEFKVKALDKKGGPAGDDEPLDFGTAEDEVFSLTEEPKPQPKSSGRIVTNRPQPKSMSDSSAGSSDSDVRLDGGKSSRKAPKGDEAAIPTEEIALDFGGPGSAVIKGGSSAKLSAPKTGGSSGKLDASSGKKGNKPQPEMTDSSEFELSLDADSDDFDIKMDPTGDEVDLGSAVKEVRKATGAASGINLTKPSDSGISLESGKGKGGDKGKGADKAKTPAKKAGDSDNSSDEDFELSLDSSAVASSTKLGAPKSGKLVLDSDSDSEFELTLDDSGGSLEQAALDANALGEAEDKGDIFETDFEIPAMPDESASEAVALESDTDLEKSDFELAMDDADVTADEEGSGSEVVLLDDEEGEAKPKKSPKVKKKPVPADDEVDLSEAGADEDDASVSKALRGAKGKPKGEEDEDEVVPGQDRPTKPWGVLPLLFLAPSVLVALGGALMGYQLLETMWGYQQPRKPTAPLVRTVAGWFSMELRDQ